MLSGLLLIPVGLQRTNSAAFYLGVSFFIIGAGLMLRGLLHLLLGRFGDGRRWDPNGLADRIAFTLLGLALTVSGGCPPLSYKTTLMCQSWAAVRGCSSLPGS